MTCISDVSLKVMPVSIVNPIRRVLRLLATLLTGHGNSNQLAQARSRTAGYIEAIEFNLGLHDP